MDDTIYRQAAVDICNNAIDLWHGQLGEGALVAVKKGIESLPSAEPEIIRCKDCKKQDTDNVFRSMWCYEMRTFVKPNEFCSRAERRTDALGHYIQAGCD